MKQSKKTWVIFVIYCTIFNLFNVAQAEVQFTITGRVLKGEASDVAAHENIVYAALTTGLLTVDISDPTHPIELGSLPIDPAISNFYKPKLALQYPLAYFAIQNELHIVNISDPAHPLEIAAYSLDAAYEIWGIAVHQNYIYLAARTREFGAANGMINVLRLSETGVIQDVVIETVSDPRDIFYADGHLYVVQAWLPAFLIYSVADPAQPRFVGKFNTNEHSVPSAVFVQDQIAYFAGYIVDVSRPDQPREIGKITRGFGDIYVQGSFAVTAKFDTTLIYDMSNPAAPALINQIDQGSDKVYWHESLILAIPSGWRDDNGLHLIDAADVYHPELKSSLLMNEKAYSIAAKDEMVYISGYDIGVHRFPDDGLYNLVDRVPLSLTPLEDRLIPLTDLLLIPDNYRSVGLNVWDWHDPARPESLSHISTPYKVHDAIQQGGFLYVACGVDISNDQFPGAFQIYDLSNPRSPRLLSSVMSPTNPFYGIAVDSKGYAYITDGRIFNVSDPAHPFEVLHLAENFNHIEIRGELAYTSSAEAIRIYDISNPPAIVLLAQYSINETGPVYEIQLFKLILQDDLLFATNERNLYTFDVSNPNVIRPVGMFHLPGLIMDFCVTTEKIYTTTYMSGVFILNYERTPNQIEPAPNETAGWLNQNYPNPFSLQTAISFSLPKAEPVTLSIYNISGQFVKSLCKDEWLTGFQTRTWDATNESGLPAAGGLYLYRLQTPSRNETRRLILNK